MRFSHATLASPDCSEKNGAQVAVVPCPPLLVVFAHPDDEFAILP